MGGVPNIAPHRRLYRLPHDRVNESQGLVAFQNLQSNQADGQAGGSVHVHARDVRGVAKFTTVPEHGDGPSQTERLGIETLNASRNLGSDALAAPGGKLSGRNLAELFSLQRNPTQQLGKVERVAPARLLQSGAHLIVHGAGNASRDRPDGAKAQKPRPHDDRRVGAHLKQRQLP